MPEPPAPKSTENQRKKAVEYIQRWIGTPYIIAGDDFSGFDCNGVIHETLQAVGVEKRGYDCTAHQLYLNYKHLKVEKEEAKAGCLVFWFRDGRARHVAMMISKEFIIHASGGDFDTLTESDAIRKNAYVKQDVLDYRGEGYKIVDPFKELK